MVLEERGAHKQNRQAHANFFFAHAQNRTHSPSSFILALPSSEVVRGGSRVGVKVRNMKMDFNTGGIWHWVGQCTLMMKIYDFFIRLSRYQAINNNM